MAERTLIERLDDAIDAMLAGRRDGLALAEPELAALLLLADDLRELPDPDFKSQLKRELLPPREETTMPAIAEREALPQQEIRVGVSTVVPYLIVRGAADFIKFVTESFDAIEELRVPLPNGLLQHASVRIGNSLLELSDGSPQYPAREVPLHLYVDDADAMYARAIAAGATSLFAPSDMPYGDREGGVRDRWGNHWYIATHQEEVPQEEVMRRFGGGTWSVDRRSEVGPAPAGLRTLTPGLRAVGTARLIEFISQSFGAREIMDRTELPDGTIAHTKMRIGDAAIELGEAHGQWGPMKSALHVFVPDVDAAYERALAAGATSLRAPADMPYGERGGSVIDPFGNSWFIATAK